MASITRRGDKWLVRVTRGSQQANKTFPTKQEAQLFAQETEAAFTRGTYTPEEKATLRELLERYRTDITSTKRGRLREEYRIDGILRHKEAKPLLDTPISKLSPVAVGKWRDARGKEVAPATVVREWAILQNALSVAGREWGYVVTRNPFEALRKPTINNARARRVSDAELDAILAAVRSPEFKAIVKLAIETAARRSELLSLRWQDISLDKRVATLRQTKNGEVRAVPLSSRAIAILKAQPRRIDGAVFGMKPHSLTTAFERAVLRARRSYEETTKTESREPGFLEDLRLHDLRHEACSRLAELGLSTTELASISGHRTLQLVARYTHHRPEQLARKLG
ncbi:MAG: site-specific integrase [Thauera sp.]|nr:site-specific integrase [Thauera sp.]